MNPDSPSDTATLIARCVLLSASVGGHAPLLASGEEEAVGGFLGSRARRGWFAFMARYRWTRWCLMAAERVLLNGISAHYLVRKRWIEREARQALAGHGTRQLVVLGAGYDSLGWRLCQEDRELRCFELDHPATQRSKRGAPGAAVAFHLLPTDLAAELPEAMLAKCPSFDPERPAVVIVEGLTMYLEPSRVAELLASCGRIAGPRGCVIFTFMERADDGSLGFRGESSWIRRWLRWRKEPFRWGCTRAELDGFLKPLGLIPRLLADHETLRREILNPRGAGELSLARGECLCLCEPIPLLIP
ncbi:class I SAM-dependent methyltransferase [Luteolibacter arcticus]|uniref:Class I SAM-dependent methyltransferase n=1 Tax=Luteolibacter arcticus TaxID=1581411 RepID=A0ABT3GGE4_9BACT|nr:class I SAM-dependent methyltransferase [Luteolibacter arcticus]MCW1922681.1 class I SAM-dependent methyltransferase [Luteolibacter arcticus]